MSGGVTRLAMTGIGSVGQALAHILEEEDLPLVVTLAADSKGYAVDSGGLDPREIIDAKSAGSIETHTRGRSGQVDAEVLKESMADVLLELASTSYENGEPGWTYIQSAFSVGLDVVLASKGPLVTHWDELFEEASERACRVGYSATHGSPLPAIDFARFGLAGSRILGIRALFNSTTGLLLEQMETGKTLDEAVAAISRGGVAETNPRLDIEGWDAAAKCVIVARSLFGGNLTLDDVKRTGIERLRTEEVVEAARNGAPIRLLCTIDPGPGQIRATVSPSRLVPGDPLATLRNGDLGILYDAEPIGPLFVASAGKSGPASGGHAGGRPTAASVIRDVLNLRN